MKIAKICFLAGVLGLVGPACDTDTDSCGDGGSCPDGGRADGGADGPTPFRLTAGTNCYMVTGISGANDGCMLNVAAVATRMDSFPVDYVVSTGTITVGNEGSLGMGFIRNNMGSFMTTTNPTFMAQPGCTWRQVTNTNLTMTGDDRFTVAVTEVESMFNPACSPIPAGGTCTSSWTWTMAINPAKSPTNRCE